MASPMRDLPGGATSSASSGSNAVVSAIPGNQPRVALLLHAYGIVADLLPVAFVSATNTAFAMLPYASGANIGSLSAASVPAATTDLAAACIAIAACALPAADLATAYIAIAACALPAACPCAVLATVSISIAAVTDAWAQHIAAGH